MKPHSSLAKKDLAMFAKHRIPAELVAEAGIVRVTDQQAREEWHLSAPSKRDLRGLLFPYTDPNNDNRMVTCRVRRDNPEIANGSY